MVCKQLRLDLLDKARLSNEATTLTRWFCLIWAFGALSGLERFKFLLSWAMKVGRRLYWYCGHDIVGNVLLSSFNAEIDIWDKSADFRDAIVRGG
ncbi:hypothetical protein SLE2022_320780 [Rubroshorea leprosula]